MFFGPCAVTNTGPRSADHSLRRFIFVVAAEIVPSNTTWNRIQDLMNGSQCLREVIPENGSLAVGSNKIML